MGAESKQAPKSTLDVLSGIDLFQDPDQASWLLQAIDPLTGELLKDTSRGLLAPDDGLGSGEGFVSYSIEPLEDLPTGTSITARARVLFDNQAPEDTQVMPFQVMDAS